MMIRRFSAVTALMVVLLAAGCARNADSESPAAPPAAAPTETVPSETGKPSAPAAGGQTITGTVSAGVEPNCLLLVGGGANHLLIFDDPALREQAKVGEEVTVVGRAEAGMMTTCQEGTPFVVTAVRPN